jgi:hypothetical protein
VLVGFVAVALAFRQTAGRFSLSVGANVTAFAFSIPLLLAVLLAAYLSHSLTFVPLGIVVLLGILPNPASVGLQAVARELASGESPDLRDQWPALRAYWRPALITWLVSTSITGVCVLNLFFYASQAASNVSSLRGPSGPLSLLWGLLLIFWLGIHLYVAPLLLAQERQDIKLAYRNEIVFTMSRPLASWTVIFLWLALLTFFTTTGLATVIGLALGAAIQQNAFRLLVPTFSARS